MTKLRWWSENLWIWARSRGLLHYVFWVRENEWGLHFLTPWHSFEGQSKVLSPTFQWLMALVHPKNHLNCFGWPDELQRYFDLPLAGITWTVTFQALSMAGDLGRPDAPWSFVLQAYLARKMTTWGKKLTLDLVTWKATSNIRRIEKIFGDLPLVQEVPWPHFNRYSNNKNSKHKLKEKETTEIYRYSESHITLLL
jgi:hypothetical protein